MGLLGKKLGKKSWLQKQPARVSSAALILENSVGQALIVKANYKSYWTFPGGIINPGETPKQAAVRETFEEVGIKINPKDVEFVVAVNRKSDYADTYQFVFKAPLKEGMLADIILQETEIDHYVLVTKGHIKTGDRRYGAVIKDWAKGHTGYTEHVFSSSDQ